MIDRRPRHNYRVEARYSSSDSHSKWSGQLTKSITFSFIAWEAVCLPIRKVQNIKVFRAIKFREPESAKCSSLSGLLHDFLEFVWLFVTVWLCKSVYDSLRLVFVASFCSRELHQDRAFSSLIFGFLTQLLTVTSQDHCTTQLTSPKANFKGSAKTRGKDEFFVSSPREQSQETGKASKTFNLKPKKKNL